MQVRAGLYQLWCGMVVVFWVAIAALIAWSSARHFSPWEAPSVFLQSRQAHYTYFLPALYVHIFSSPLVLILGSCSLWPALRQFSPVSHRLLGKSYVVLVLAMAAPSGFIMAFLALGGWAGILCFVVLSLLWAGMTWQAWRAALQRRWKAHQAFMWRSFALTTSAFFLRFFSFVGAYCWQWRGPTVYVGLAWASWLVPLLLVELGLLVRRLGR